MSSYYHVVQLLPYFSHSVAHSPIFHRKTYLHFGRPFFLTFLLSFIADPIPLLHCRHFLGTPVPYSRIATLGHDTLYRFLYKGCDQESAI